MKLRIKKLTETAKLPTRAHEDDAGLDLYPDTTTILRSGEVKIIPTGIAMEIPSGYAGFIYPRSGNAVKYGITLINAVGIIDSQYRGNIGLTLYNTSDRNFNIHREKALAQIIIKKIEVPEVEIVTELSETIRGDNGFGSSDKRKRDDKNGGTS